MCSFARLPGRAKACAGRATACSVVVGVDEVGVGLVVGVGGPCAGQVGGAGAGAKEAEALGEWVGEARVVDEGVGSEAAAAGGAGEDVEVEAALHQSGPIARGAGTRGMGGRGAWGGHRVGAGRDVGRSAVGHDARSHRGVRGEDAEVDEEVLVGAGHERGGLLDELERGETQVRGSIRPAGLQRELDLSVVAEAEALLGERRPQ